MRPVRSGENFPPRPHFGFLASELNQTQRLCAPPSQTSIYMVYLQLDKHMCYIALIE